MTSKVVSARDYEEVIKDTHPNESANQYVTMRLLPALFGLLTGLLSVLLVLGIESASGATSKILLVVGSLLLFATSIAIFSRSKKIVHSASIHNSSDGQE